MADPGDGAYGLPFWLTYANNLCLMSAVSMLFRYADFVHLLGGTELHLGRIVGVGMIGSLAMRLVQGVAIDRYGSRVIWLTSVMLFAVSCAAHLALGRVDGVAIYLVRVLMSTSVAGAFGASITYISRRAPVLRMAEVVGTLGTSGFVGMVAGTSLGDLICGGTPDRARLDLLFGVAAGLALVSFLFGCFATRGQVPPQRRRRLPVLWVLRRYHPGPVLLMGIAVGFGISLPATFVRPFVATLQIADIALFFLVYSTTAFVTRLAIRRLPQRIGIRPMVLWGLASLVASMLLYLPVRVEWHLAAPAVLVGIAHAMLFPAVVAGGSGAFPTRHRGVGTTLMLGTYDLGTLIGAPTVGALLEYSGRLGLPPYPTMFIAVAGLLTAAGCIYAVASLRRTHQTAA
jgi:MFS family permease